MHCKVLASPPVVKFREKNRPTAGISLIETSRRPAVVSFNRYAALLHLVRPPPAEPVPGPGSPFEDDLIATGAMRGSNPPRPFRPTTPCGEAAKRSGRDPT